MFLAVISSKSGLLEFPCHKSNKIARASGPRPRVEEDLQGQGYQSVASP